MIPGIVAGRTSSDPVAAAIIAKLTSWWEMDEASGTRYDSKGTNHLSIFGSVSTAPGARGSDLSASFGGSGGLSAADASNLRVSNVNPYCLFGWYFVSSNATNQGFCSKYDDTASGGITNEYSLSLQSGVMYASHGNSGGTGSSSASATPPSAGSWHYVVMWRDPADGKVRLTIDDGPVYVSPNTTSAPTTAQPIRFGFIGPTVIYSMTGRLQRWGWIQDAMLTAAERTYLYNVGTGVKYSELSSA